MEWSECFLPGTEEVLLGIMLVPPYHLIQSGAIKCNPNNYLLNYIEFLKPKGLSLMRRSRGKFTNKRGPRFHHVLEIEILDLFSDSL